MPSGTKTAQAISTFAPRWTNQHTKDCPVTKQREDLWEQFVRDPTNGALHGAVIEYDNGGDQEVENCECIPLVLEVQGEYHTGKELWHDARALALAVEGFNFKVARDTNTHDGQPRGMDWSEGPPYADSEGLRNLARRLRNLAKLWESG